MGIEDKIKTRDKRTREALNKLPRDTFVNINLVSRPLGIQASAEAYHTIKNKMEICVIEIYDGDAGMFNAFYSPAIRIPDKATSVLCVPPSPKIKDNQGIVAFHYRDANYEVRFGYSAERRKIIAEGMMEEELERIGKVAVPKGTKIIGQV